MSPVALVAWGIEFALETSGAILAYRKRLTILAALLAWRALMDVVTFAIFINHLHPGYSFTFWAGRAVQYALLYALGVQIAARMVADYRPIWQHVYLILAAVASLAAYIFVLTEVWAHKFLHAEAVTCFLLLAVVLLGWIGRKRDLEEPWKLVTLAMCIGSTGTAICAILAASWPWCLSLYPVPAIPALLLWNLAAWKPIKLPEFRKSLPRTYQKKPVESVKITSKQTWVMPSRGGVN